MALTSQIQGEEYFRVLLGQGMYTAELPSNIPDGFSAICYNVVATGDSLENRMGIRQSSIDFKVFDYAAGSGKSPDTEKTNILYQLNPNIYNSDAPAFAWGSWGESVPDAVSNGPHLNLIRSHGAANPGDGYIRVPMPASINGICQYLDTVYFLIHSLGVYKITAIDWVADTVTYAQIPSSAGAIFHGLFPFKDRLWAYQNQWLYFTDIAPSGGYPETWAFTTNRIPFVGASGIGAIKKVVPLGNKLIVFTSAGLFTLLVEGSPQSWILRQLDSESICTTSQCAFESKNIVYYVNTQGVWATNGLQCTKLSSVIEDQWFLAKGTRVHTINSYEDGMIVSIGKLLSSDANKYDSKACRTFYSKLDPISWTEWNVMTADSYDDENFAGYRIASIQSVTRKIPTFLNPDPTVFMMAYITNSTEADPKNAVLQLLIFDGGKDQYWTNTGAGEQRQVSILLKTKYIDGGNPYNLKQCKRGLVELFTSDSQHKFRTSWDIDASVGESTMVRTIINQDYTVGVGSNLIQIPSLFHYRRCALMLMADLQSDESQIKIKDIAVVQNTERSEFEKVR